MAPTRLERQLFGYDAVSSSPRRKAPVVDSRIEDVILDIFGRDLLGSSSLDAKRNFAIAAWMIRKHVSFVADFRFLPNTPNEKWNEQAKRFINRWSQKDRCHVSRRHRLRKLMRIAEIARVTHGDLVWELMKDGSVNLIRGDRIRNPFGAANSREWINGIQIDPRTERHLGYQIHRRLPFGTFVPEKYLPARNAIHHGYFDDPEQHRGVSPLSTAINSLRDTYEAIDFALTRLKAEQLLGIVFSRDPDVGTNPFAGNQQYEVDYTDDDRSEEEQLEREQQAADDESKSGLVDYGKGIFQVQLDKGEDLKFVNGNMPSTNAQEFMKATIHIALKALDIPYSFFSEDFTNFHASRGAFQLYKRSAEDKREDNQEILDTLTRWRLKQAIIEGEIDLPRGWKLDEIEFTWVPDGIPWWDRSKEVIGDIRAIAAGFDNPQQVCLNAGTGTFEENVKATAEACRIWQQHLGEFGIPFGFASIISAGSGTGLKTGTEKDSGKDNEEEDDE